VYDIGFRHQKVAAHYSSDTKNRVASLQEKEWILTLKIAVGVTGVLIGVVGMIVCVAAEVITHERIGGPFFLATVQAWMTFKWSLSYTMHHYHHHNIAFSEQQQPILVP
jgi:hypothetical protein